MQEVQVFRPTWEEFQHFDRYISYMECKGAHLAGMAKVSFFNDVLFRMAEVISNTVSGSINSVLFA